MRAGHRKKSTPRFVAFHAVRSGIESKSQFPAECLARVSGHETSSSRSLPAAGRGLKSQPNLNPGGCTVESTSSNSPIGLKKRVADCKHGFESRLRRAHDDLPRPI